MLESIQGAEISLADLIRVTLKLPQSNSDAPEKRQVILGNSSLKIRHVVAALLGDGPQLDGCLTALPEKIPKIHIGNPIVPDVQIAQSKHTETSERRVSAIKPDHPVNNSFLLTNLCNL